MAVSGADVSLVDPLATDLIYFIGSMPVPRFRVTQARLIVSAIVAAAVLVAISPMTRAAFDTGCPASGPCATPTPTPTAANIVLDFAAGGPSTRITATGSYFLANESMSLFWDTQAHVAASVTTDSSGNFSKVVTPFPGDGPGAHRLCATVPPGPCANFTLQGSPTPTPTTPPSPSPGPTPSASPSGSPSPSASPLTLTVDGGRGGLDVITKPPLVFLPIIALLALLAALAYWILMRGDRTPVLPSASVVHRSARPEIGPVAPPPAPPEPPEPSAPPEPPA